MATFQNTVLECSRQNASVLLDDTGTSWINEFTATKLEKGDTIRILGSFVNEEAQGDEIEITDEMSVNIVHTPFIRGHTLATADTQNNLLDLGTFSDIAYTTDATGIEPPHFMPQVEPGPDGGVTQPLGSDTLYENVLGTASSAQVYGPTLNSKSQWNFDNGSSSTDVLDKAECTGLTIDTSKNYGLFANNSVDNELYLAQMVKRFILPVADGFANRNVTADLRRAGMDFVYQPTTIRTSFEPLISDTTNYTKDQAGRFGGAPRPGMLIATVNIAGGFGWYDSKGDGLYETNYGANYNGFTVLEGDIRKMGVPNLVGGVESMIGKIIAVKPFKRIIKGFYSNCFEIYVTDWINPAAIKKDVYRRTIPLGNYRYADTTTINTRAQPVECIKFCHGSGQNDIGYNKNPAFNPINGQYNQYTPRIGTRGSDTGSTTGYFIQSNSRSNGWASEAIRTGSDNPSTAADTGFKFGYGQPWGLSFPYNGGQCAGIVSQGEAGVTNEMRANSYSIWYRDPPIGNPLDIACQMYDADFDNTRLGTPKSFTFLPPLSEPQVMGAYICVNEEVMMDIVKNGQDLLSETNNGSALAGHFPRIWMEWGFQNFESQYSTRHYKDNSYDRDVAAPHNLTKNNASYANRAVYDMCGKPDNRNFKIGTHDFGNNTTSLAAGAGIGSYLPQQVNDVFCVSDGTPNIQPTDTGLFNYTSGLGSTSGTPIEYCGYNNALNSIHFQQKDTGSITLSRNNNIIEITIHTSVAGSPTFFDVDTGSPSIVPQFGMFVFSTSINNTISYFPRNWNRIIVNPTPKGGNIYQLDFALGMNNPTAGTKLYLATDLNGGTSESGYGTTAKPWSADLLMIKEYVSQIKVKPGYYTKEQLGASINDVLHYKTKKYAKELGTRITSGDNQGQYNVPTTVGKLCEALGSEPTFINGNFVHTYIPEVTYGFTPVTSENAVDMNLTASTADLTNELLTYDYDGTFYDPEVNPPPAHNGTSVRYVWETDQQNRTYFGKHIKLYSPPHLAKDDFNETQDQIHLIRLKGGSLPKDSQDSTTKIWNISAKPRFSGMYESLRTQMGEPNIGTYSTFAYRCRGVTNICNHGGSAKIFCGANNISIEFNELANRFNLFNLFTPIRPHQSQNPAKQDFDIDDAVPSAIICTKFTGDNDGVLTGTYISNLNGGAITEKEWGRQWADFVEYDTETNTTILKYGTNLLDALGYNSNQLSKYVGYGINKDVSQPYTFATELREYGSLIRGDVKLTPAINGTNPFANDCLMINPVLQYFVQVESEDFFADSPPTLGTSPYYFIGSDLPINHFYGNDTGTKLPVVGINARNFHSFGFSFDVGATSVEFTIDRPKVITSIKTAIYDSNLKTPTNISKFSSVIYIITKNNYAPSAPPDVLENVELQRLRNRMIPEMYFVQPRNTQLTTPPIDPNPDYYTASWNGSLNSIYEEEIDSDYTED